MGGAVLCRFIGFTVNIYIYTCRWWWRMMGVVMRKRGSGTH